VQQKAGALEGTIYLACCVRTELKEKIENYQQRETGEEKMSMQELKNSKKAMKLK